MTTITLNGESFTAQNGETLAGLIARLELDSRKIAIERNLSIVPHSAYEGTVLTAGDQIEIIQFIGGG